LSVVPFVPLDPCVGVVTKTANRLSFCPGVSFASISVKTYNKNNKIFDEYWSILSVGEKINGQCKNIFAHCLTERKQKCDKLYFMKLFFFTDILHFFFVGYTFFENTIILRGRRDFELGVQYSSERYKLGLGPGRFKESLLLVKLEPKRYFFSQENLKYLRFSFKFSQFYKVKLHL
jgi:hypothetical protein